MTCANCKADKPSDQFYLDGQVVKDFPGYCKTCSHDVMELINAAFRCKMKTWSPEQMQEYFANGPYTVDQVIKMLDLDIII